jgi:hypothetical protein
MIETNIRLVEPGPELQLKVRYMRVQASDESPDLLWKACGALMGRGLAAVPSGRSELVVATDQPISAVELRDEDWHLKARDSGYQARLTFENLGEVGLLEKLVERLLLVQIQRRTHLWRMDSASIWYEARPFMAKDGIAAYRRYEISGVALGDAGIGIAVDMGTAFFTEWTVADFFREDLPQREQERRRERFEALSARQRGQKGTLLYYAAQSSHKCYFDRVAPGMTCATTGELTIRGRHFDSLHDYYAQQQPGMEVGADEPVAYVSFRGVDRARPVSAKRLRLRVMNDALPRSLKQVDKMSPEERSASIGKFWERLGGRPLGRGKPVVRRSFWRPPEEKVLAVSPPALKFGEGKILDPPSNGSARGRRDHFRERGRLLDRSGCSEVPPTMTRTIHFAVPQQIGEATATRLADDVIGRLSRWTGKRVNWELVAYEDTEDAIARSRSQGSSSSYSTTRRRRTTRFRTSSGLGGSSGSRATPWWASTRGCSWTSTTQRRITGVHVPDEGGRRLSR